MVNSGKEKAATFHDIKYQGGKALPFLGHDFTGYHTMEWYQWEVNIQLLTKGAIQLNSANDIGGEVKALIVKLYTVHKKDTIRFFFRKQETTRSQKFPEISKGGQRPSWL
eukprot:4567179-Ditylum_brightwellii.AAC.1